MKNYNKYVKLVEEGARKELRKKGVNAVCIDKIQECWDDGDSIQDAIDTVYLDTLYWEGKLV